MRRPPPAHEAALRAVQKPPVKPWRGGGAAPAPPKVYRVEPREFRELVQRVTGAPGLARQQQAVAAAPMQPVPVPVRAGGEDAQLYAALPWCSYSLSMAGLDAHHGMWPLKRSYPLSMAGLDAHHGM